MSRCQHCNKLTHNEHLIVEFEKEKIEKMDEIQAAKDWRPLYEYNFDCKYPPNELGKLKCGDIWIHFRVKMKNDEK